MRDNMRRTVADDKERADELIASFGGSYAKYRPGYVKPGVWSRLCEYWVTDEFKKKSNAGKKARSNVKAPHTSGARSFNRRERVWFFIIIEYLSAIAAFKQIMFKRGL